MGSVLCMYDGGVSQQCTNVAASVLSKVELASETKPSPIIVGTGRGSHENDE